MDDVTINPGIYTLPECSFTAPENNHFAYWTINQGDNHYNPGDQVEVTSDITIIAEWEENTPVVTEYTVSFNANGGTGSMTSQTSTGEYTTPQNGFTAPEGKIFGGWLVNNEGEILDIGQTIEIASDITLYPQWDDETPVTTEYTVSFNANGGTGSMASQTTAGEFVVPDHDFMAPSGMTFVGWKIDNIGDLIEVEQNLTVTEDITLYAQWEEETPAVTEYMVYFDSNGGEGSMDEQATAGEFVAPDSDFTAPQGKEFIGWKIDNEGELIEVEQNITVTHDITLYAQWEEEQSAHLYTVSFDANEGSGTMESEGCDESYTVPNSTFIAPEDKTTFTGWKIDNEGYLIEPGETIPVEGDITLYAQWDMYQITFMDDNTGEILMTDEAEVNSEYSFPEFELTHPTGQFFDKWYVTEGTVSGYYSPGDTYTITANINVYPTWRDVQESQYQLASGFNDFLSYDTDEEFEAEIDGLPSVSLHAVTMEDYTFELLPNVGAYFANSVAINHETMTENNQAYLNQITIQVSGPCTLCVSFSDSIMREATTTGETYVFEEAGVYDFINTDTTATFFNITNVGDNEAIISAIVVSYYVQLLTRKSLNKFIKLGGYQL